ncbi:hypothetical protein Bca4012_020671 [Brassica carinata]
MSSTRPASSKEPKDVGRMDSRPLDLASSEPESSSRNQKNPQSPTEKGEPSSLMNQNAVFSTVIQSHSSASPSTSTEYPPASLPGQGIESRLRFASPGPPFSSCLPGSRVTDPTRKAESEYGSPPLPVNAYQNGQGFDPVRAQIQPASHLGSGHLKGVPYFLQPRVRITEGASLYSLCRSWLRNGAYEGVQKQQSDTTVTCLPKPLPMVEKSLLKDLVEEPNSEEDKELQDEESVKQLSDSDLLKRHVDRAKKVRARLREERLKRILRYKARLALLLPPFGEQCRDE